MAASARRGVTPLGEVTAGYNFIGMQAFSRNNRCQSAVEGIRVKPQLARSCSFDPRASREPAALCSATECSRIVCVRQAASPGQGKYNKWFIPPHRRLKRSLPPAKPDNSSDDFLYRQLFRLDYPDPQNPFQRVPSQKLASFDKISKKGVSLIEEFRRSQLLRRKRVPQIVEMLVEHAEQRFGI